LVAAIRFVLWIVGCRVFWMQSQFFTLAFRQFPLVPVHGAQYQSLLPKPSIIIMPLAINSFREGKRESTHYNQSNGASMEIDQLVILFMQNAELLESTSSTLLESERGELLDVIGMMLLDGFDR
jgi:hypothetical protein